MYYSRYLLLLKNFNENNYLPVLSLKMYNINTYRQMARVYYAPVTAHSYSYLDVILIDIFVQKTYILNS